MKKLINPYSGPFYMQLYNYFLPILTSSALHCRRLQSVEKKHINSLVFNNFILNKKKYEKTIIDKDQVMDVAT